MTRIAVCQLAPTVSEVEGNRALARSALAEAAAAGAEVVVLPELMQSGYVFESPEESRAVAEPADGPTVSEWCELSRAYGVVLVAGFAETNSDGGLPFNSAALIDRGELLAVYRKAHLWDEEKLHFTPGDAAPPVVDTSAGRIGVVICYDLEFPEFVRLVGLAGAELLAAPTNWPWWERPDGERPTEVVKVQANASVNHLVVAAADRYGTERGVAWIGGSVIVDENGWPVAGPIAADKGGILTADLDLTRARDKAVSARNDVLADRRPELY